jgi:hypothetical protein
MISPFSRSLRDSALRLERFSRKEFLPLGWGLLFFFHFFRQSLARMDDMKTREMLGLDRVSLADGVDKGPMLTDGLPGMPHQSFLVSGEKTEGDDV